MRLERIEREYLGQVEVEWRSFLLRPQPEARDVGRFRAYTARWRAAAELEPGATFRPWATAEAPPSHSLPPAVAGKAAARLGADCFRRFHLGLMRAYFADNRTISDPGVIIDVARAEGLPVAQFAALLDEAGDALARQVVTEHNQAVQHGITAVPAVLVNDQYVLTGAMEEERYRRVIERAGATAR